MFANDYIKLMSTGRTYKVVYKSEGLAHLGYRCEYVLLEGKDHKIMLDSLGRVFSVLLSSNITELETSKDYELVDDTKFTILARDSQTEKIFRREGLHYPAEYTNEYADSRVGGYTLGGVPVTIWTNVYKVAKPPNIFKHIASDRYSMTLHNNEVTELSIILNTTIRCVDNPSEFGEDIITYNKKMSEYLTILGVPHTYKQ